MIKLNTQLEEQKSTETEADKLKSFVSLAPINLASLIIDGITIHKFCCAGKSYIKINKIEVHFGWWGEHVTGEIL